MGTLNVKKPFSFLGSFVSPNIKYEFDCEFAFVGRSNVGKSTFINTITNQSIARTSKNPGRTQQINIFQAYKSNTAFVDLPGYGFAKASEKTQQKWSNLIPEYMKIRSKKINVFVLFDINVPIMSTDIQMMELLKHYDIKTYIVLTKIDKLKSVSNVQTRLQEKIDEFNKLGFGYENCFIFTSNSKSKTYAISNFKEMSKEMSKIAESSSLNKKC